MTCICWEKTKYKKKYIYIEKTYYNETKKKEKMMRNWVFQMKRYLTKQKKKKNV